MFLDSSSNSSNEIARYIENKAKERRKRKTASPPDGSK